MLSRRSFHSFATIAWKMAAMQTASSTRVQTSQLRNSSVGKRWFGRASYQIFDPSGMHRVFTIVSTIESYSSHEPNRGGMPDRGKWRKMIDRYDFSPVFRPHQNGELVDRQSRCGTK